MSTSTRTPRWLLVEALVMTIAARTATAVLPFRWLIRLLVPLPASSPATSPPATSPEVSQVCYAVARMARFPRPWAVCLPQALAAHWMLARRAVPTRIRFGVRMTPGPPGSHAWLLCDGRAILGGRAGVGYEPVLEVPAGEAR